MTVFEKIESQQKGREGTPAWMVGEQLKDICASDVSCAELVAQDLGNKDMSLEKAAGKIKTFADELHKKQKGSCVCVPPNEAERIIREFYGLPAATAPRLSIVKPVPVAEPEDDGLDLFDYLGGLWP